MLVRLVKETYFEFLDDGGVRLAAALAYYTLFAIAPIAIIAVAVASLLLGEAAARIQLAKVGANLFGEQVADLIRSLLADFTRPEITAVATAVGAGIFLLGAVRLFIQLQDSLNTMFAVKLKPGIAWRRIALARLVPFAMVFLPGVLMVIILFANSVSSVVGDLLRGGAGRNMLQQLTELLLPLAIAWLAFTLLLKTLPDIRVRWRHVLAGGLLTASAAAVGTYVFGLYLSRGSLTSLYGAAGSFLALLLWIHFVAFVVLLGGKFTHVYARMSGAPVQPAAYAVRVKRVVVEEEQNIPRHENMKDQADNET